MKLMDNSKEIYQIFIFFQVERMNFFSSFFFYRKKKEKVKNK